MHTGLRYFDQRLSLAFVEVFYGCIFSGAKSSVIGDCGASLKPQGQNYITENKGKLAQPTIWHATCSYDCVRLIKHLPDLCASRLVVAKQSTLLPLLLIVPFVSDAPLPLQEKDGQSIITRAVQLTALDFFCQASAKI